MNITIIVKVIISFLSEALFIINILPVIILKPIQFKKFTIKCSTNNNHFSKKIINCYKSNKYTKFHLFLIRLGGGFVYMKFKIIPMFFIMLVLLIVSFSDNAHAAAPDPIKIKVSIFEPDELRLIICTIPSALLHNYSWVVNDTTYIFNVTKVMPWNESRLHDQLIYLNNKETDLLIMDGTALDCVACATPGLGIVQRQRFKNYIDNKGGFIGRCGGGNLPLSLYDYPDTPIEKWLYQKNAFLNGMKTTVNVQFGLPIISGTPSI